MRHPSQLLGVVLIIVFDFFLRIFHPERSQLGMVSCRGRCHGTTRQSPGFPGLTEEVQPTLLIDHLQVELFAAVVFGIHPHGIVHHVGGHIIAQRPDVKITDICGILRIIIGPTTGVLRKVCPEEERLIDTRTDGFIRIERRGDATDVAYFDLCLHKQHIRVGDQDLRNIFLIPCHVVVERRIEA